MDRVLDFARTQPVLLKRVEDTGKLPMGELSAGSAFLIHQSDGCTLSADTIESLLQQLSV